VPELMTGAEPFPVRSRSIAHIDDRAVLEADDLCLAADEPPVQDLRADAIGDGEEVDSLASEIPSSTRSCSAGRKRSFLQLAGFVDKS
jgi:hypothetical protein